MADEQTDHVKFGSVQHAQLLGLVKAEKDDELQYKGWTLQDPTQWGPNARPEFVKAQLIQKVSELTNAPTVPAGAPTMWTPSRGL